VVVNPLLSAASCPWAPKALVRPSNTSYRANKPAERRDLNNVAGSCVGCCAGLGFPPSECAAPGRHLGGHGTPAACGLPWRRGARTTAWRTYPALRP